MIVEGLVNLLVGIADFIASLLGDLQPPSFMTNVPAQISQLVALGDSMGSWVPWNVFAGALVAVLAMVALSLVIRVARILLSLFTGGGGSAA